MELKNPERLRKAFTDLERVIESYSLASKSAKRLYFLALTKAFEVAIEYSWKEIKRKVEDRGLEAFSPKDAIREGAKLGFIEEPEEWIDAINARNLSVHDYFSLSEQDFVALIKTFYQNASRAFGLEVKRTRKSNRHRS